MFRISATIIFLLVIFIEGGFAQHFDFRVTSLSASVIVRNISLTDRHLGDMDEIAVYNEGELCAGATVIEEFPIGIAVWGDDRYTEEIDGFLVGDEYFYYLWDASADEEIILDQVDILEGENEWFGHGFTVIELSDNGRHFQPHPTRYRHHIICENLDIITNDGQHQAADLDQIGVFTADGIAAGLLIWNGETGSAEGWAYADDPETELTEGFLQGDSFEFRFWERETDWETVAVPEIIEGDSVFIPEIGESYISLDCFDLSVSNHSSLLPEFELVSVYPNPFNSNLNLSLRSNRKCLIRVDIFDMFGRKIKSYVKSTANTGNNNLSIPFEGFGAGSYLCTVSTDKSRTSVLVNHVK